MPQYEYTLGGITYKSMEELLTVALKETKVRLETLSEQHRTDVHSAIVALLGIVTSQYIVLNNMRDMIGMLETHDTALDERVTALERVLTRGMNRT
jgi:hypothetical protein